MIYLNMPQGTTSVIGFRRAVYVNALEYGCVGDGTADDTAGLQAALNDAANKLLYLPGGTYLVSKTLTVPTSCTILGDGMGLTTIKPNPILTTLTNAVLAITASNVTVRNLTIAGNGGASVADPAHLPAPTWQVNLYGITISASGLNGKPLTGNNVVLEDVEITGFGAAGIYASISTAANVQFTGPYLSNVYVHAPGAVIATAPTGAWGNQVAIQIGSHASVTAFSPSAGSFSPVLEGVRIVAVQAGVYCVGCLTPIIRHSSALGVAGAGDNGFAFEGCSGGMVSACVADGFLDSSFSAYTYNDNCRFIGCTSRNAQWTGFNFWKGNYDISVTDCRSVNTAANGTDFLLYYTPAGGSARHTFSNIEVYNANVYSPGGNFALAASGVAGLDIRGARIYVAQALGPTIQINGSGVGGMGTVIMRDIRMETGAGTNTQTAIALHGTTADIAGNNYTNYATPAVTA